jgi:hypothetical protein
MRLANTAAVWEEISIFLFTLKGLRRKSRVATGRDSRKIIARLLA